MKLIEDRAEFRSLQVAYEDRCDFGEVDVAQYDLESHLGTVPYLLVQLQYEQSDSEPIVLGWSRVTPYERQESAGQQQQQFARPRRSRVTCPVYPGYLPDDPLNWQPGELPDFDEDDPEERQMASEYRDSIINAYVGDFSELSIHYYPIDEGPSPEPRQQATPPPPPPPVARKEATPTPPPPQPEEEPVKQPRHIPKRHWTIHDPAIEKTYPTATGTNQPFDVYIDQVRFMLDGITIVKLTGRFLNTGHDTAIPDILLVPNPKVSPRNLNFFASYRVQVAASDALVLQRDSALVVRVYTLVKPSLELVVVGTCVLPIFDDQGRIQAGGHQVRLREHSSVSANATTLSVSLDGIQRARSLPCVTALFRILPATARVLDPPEYISGYYRSQDCYPTDYELRVFQEHDKYETYPETFSPLIGFVQSKDGGKAAPASDYNQVMAYVPARMDPAKCLPANTAPKPMPPERYFHYRPMSGAYARLEAAFGLPAEGGGLVFAVTTALVGVALLDAVPSKALGIGYHTMAVAAPSPSSTVAAPRYQSRPELLRPRADPANCLLVQFFRVPGVTYSGGAKFWVRGAAAATEAGAGGQRDELTELRAEHFVAWAVCPLLEYEFTFTGRHRIPVFPQSDLPLTTSRVRSFRQRGIHATMKNDRDMPNYVATASALMSLTDGHLDYKEAAADAEIQTVLYQYLTKTTPADYQTAIDATGGVPVRSVIDTDGSDAGFVQESQAALETLVSAVPGKKFEPLFVAA